MDFNQLLLASQIAQADVTMRITQDERRWALAIKQAVAENDAIRTNLSDFDCAQYAIVTRGNTQEALQRIEGMERFKQEYGVDHSPQQGFEYLERAMTMLPAFLLHLDNAPNTNEAILVLDSSVCYPETILSVSREGGAEYNWRSYVVAIYYMYYSCQPTLFSIRDGMTLLVDCGQVGWENLSMDFERRLHEELRAFYPLRWKLILAYNTGTIANLWWGLFKRLMSQQMRDVLRLGCQVIGADPETRLRQLFLQPSLEGAKQNILQRAKTLIALRNFNAQHFTL